jgi:hypothetical protein
MLCVSVSTSQILLLKNGILHKKNSMYLLRSKALRYAVFEKQKQSQSLNGLQNPLQWGHHYAKCIKASLTTPTNPKLGLRSTYLVKTDGGPCQGMLVAPQQ